MLKFYQLCSDTEPMMILYVARFILCHTLISTKCVILHIEIKKLYVKICAYVKSSTVYRFNANKLLV